MAESKLAWQSKLVLLLVVPYLAISVAWQMRDWEQISLPVTIWTLGLSVLLGLAAWKMHAATGAAAATGALLAAGMTFWTLDFPYRPWRTALIPVFTVLVLTTLATRYGRLRKEGLGTAEKRIGRGAAQVAANLGVAALVFEPSIRSWMLNRLWFPQANLATVPLFVVGLAALAEAAADTVSSEIGQVLGGQPRMITSFRRVDAGTDGAISVAGTLAGVAAAGVVAGVGVWALRGDRLMLAESWAGGVFGLFFDSWLGAAVERRGWLNNDAVNFLSTASAAGFALGALMVFSDRAMG